jgi:REP element-mobilizing transposase RayT
MANTYSQIYIQLVFAVKGRSNLVSKQHKEELYKYMTGIIRNKGQKLLAIDGMPDHVHIFVGMTPDIAISDLVKEVKRCTTNWVNEEKEWYRGKFYWQEGFGAFSYSRSHIDRVVKYIHNQEAHHKRRTFKEEYIGFLKKFEVEYDERYLFEWIDVDYSQDGI